MLTARLSRLPHLARSPITDRIAPVEITDFAFGISKLPSAI
jgi:hypothetical protein